MKWGVHVTIDEAIQHCKEIAAENTEESGYDECKAKLLQLVDWLEELKTLRIERNELYQKYIAAKTDRDSLLNQEMQRLEMKIVNEDFSVKQKIQMSSLNDASHIDAISCSRFREKIF